jgi:hypothetical protein
MKGMGSVCGRPASRAGHLALIILLGGMFVALLSAALPVSAAEVRNIRPGEQGGNAFFTYDLVGQKGEKEAEVSVILILDGKEYQEGELHLTGDYGTVRIGKHKRVTWQMKKDFPDGFDGEVAYRITASSVAAAPETAEEEIQAEPEAVEPAEPAQPAERPHKQKKSRKRAAVAAAGFESGHAGGKMLTETGTVTALDLAAGAIVIQTGKGKKEGMTVGAAIQADTAVTVMGKKVPVSEIGEEIAVGDTVTLKYLKGDDLYALQIIKRE